jgi:hypothetical protein
MANLALFLAHFVILPQVTYSHVQDSKLHGHSILYMHANFRICPTSLPNLICIPDKECPGSKTSLYHTDQKNTQVQKSLVLLHRIEVTMV